MLKSFQNLKEETPLIAEFKKQHKEIISLFDSLISYMAGEIVAKINILTSLRKLKNLLIKHLELEDSTLYPKLKQAKNKKVRKTGNKFFDEMLKISKIVFDFFDRYIHLKISELESNKKFKKELKTISTIIAKRINTEEKILFPLYEKYYGFGEL